MDSAGTIATSPSFPFSFFFIFWVFFFLFDDKNKRNEVQPCRGTFFFFSSLTLFSSSLPPWPHFLVFLQGRQFIPVTVRHHALFFFLLSFSPPFAFFSLWTARPRKSFMEEVGSQAQWLGVDCFFFFFFSVSSPQAIRLSNKRMTI